MTANLQQANGDLLIDDVVLRQQNAQRWSIILSIRGRRRADGHLARQCHDEILIDVLDLFEHAVEAVAQGAEFVVTYLDDATTAASASPVITTIGIVVKASI